MRSLSVLLALLVAAFLPCAFAQDSSTNGEDEVLQLLIEKAEERERLFDNVEVKSRREMLWTGLESPEIFHDSWAKTGPNRKLTYKNWSGDGERTSVESAETETDLRGIVTYYDSEGGQDRRGSIMKANNVPLPVAVFSPEHFGVTTLPIQEGDRNSGMGSLANFLNPEARKRPVRKEEYEDVIRDLYFAGEETIDGRTFLVVEEKTFHEPSSLDCTVSVYFDPTLNYACAMVKITKKWPKLDGAQTELITMDDFQEIKPGLFVPHTMSHKYADQYIQPIDGKRINRERTTTQVIEKIEWRDDFEEDFFDIEFPVGTKVTDYRTESPLTYTVGGTPPSNVDIDPREGVVRIDDMLSDPEETEAGIEETPAAGPVEPEPAVAEDEEEPSGHGFLSALFRAGIVIILLAVAAFLFLKRRKRS